MMEPGQKDSDVFSEKTRVFADEVQRRLFPLGVRDGVRQGRPRVPFVVVLRGFVDEGL
jgi:hypothetical protein